MPDSPFAHLSDSIAATVEAVAPSVVRVEARRRGNASGVAWSADGLVIASDHTVQRDDDLRVGLPSGEIVEAELVGRDPTTDLALLRTEADLTPPTWAEADTVSVGHLLLSVGRHDEPAQTAMGIVARRAGAWRTGAGGRVDALLVTHIPVYPGFSGSAVTDARGRVVGLGTSHWGRRAALAIPTSTLRRVAGALAEHGHVPHGYLGVTTQPARLRGGGHGLLILDVADGSPADHAGVLVGDVLVGLGDESIRGAHDLVAALAEAAGQTRTLHIVRGGAPITLDAEVGVR
ncbi:MAG: trypsin-like peptidase domain-containing protein [Bacteroidota bacterium]